MSGLATNIDSGYQAFRRATKSDTEPCGEYQIWRYSALRRITDANKSTSSAKWKPVSKLVPDSIHGKSGTETLRSPSALHPDLPVHNLRQLPRTHLVVA